MSRTTPGLTFATTSAACISFRLIYKIRILLEYNRKRGKCCYDDKELCKLPAGYRREIQLCTEHHTAILLYNLLAPLFDFTRTLVCETFWWEVCLDTENYSFVHIKRAGNVRADLLSCRNARDFRKRLVQISALFSRLRHLRDVAFQILFLHRRSTTQSLPTQ